jgi:glycosyltransferase involved in cell wall biosynthesis
MHAVGFKTLGGQITAFVVLCMFFGASLYYFLTTAFETGVVFAEKNPEIALQETPILYARIHTEEGIFKVRFLRSKAPFTVKNFIRLSKKDFYNETQFHRVIKGFMIQGGDPLTREEDTRGTDNFSFPVKKIPEAKSVWNILRNIFLVTYYSWSCDIVHAYDAWPFAFYTIFVPKKKVVVSGVGTYTIAPFRNRFKKFFLKYIFGNAKAIPCISEYVKSRVDSIVPEAKTSVVLMGLTKFPETGNSSDILERYQISDSDSPIVISVGEIKSRKGQFYTAQAIMSLKKDFPHIKYLIVGKNGSDTYVQDIRNLDPEGHTLQLIHDAKTDADLEQLYKRSDIFALNSVNDDFDHFEGFGLVVLEANQFGKPAVGSLGCGVENAISDGVSGYHCRQQDTLE